MKIGVVGDVHWSKYSSIVRSRGDKYSTRLENCIQSINWAEKLFESCECSMVVYLGDFFDKCDLSSEELSALTDIKWDGIPHTFLVGNHEMGLNDLSFSSSHVFNLVEDVSIIDSPTEVVVNGTPICFIPYILEESREPFVKYSHDKNAIVFSHNDLKGIKMGMFESVVGFDVEEVSKNCGIFINGHIHNCGKITKNVINIGNLTGQNFSEDATKYPHSVIVLDTDSLECAVYDNPHAMNFVKFDTTGGHEVSDVYETIKSMSNPVVTIKTTESNKHAFDDLTDMVLASRIIIEPEHVHNEKNDRAFESLSINHLESFREYILNELGTDDSVVEELNGVIG